LPSADDLFSTQEERDDATREKVAILPLDVIDDHPNHPFKVRMDAEMQELSDSVRQYGVLVPGLVRPKADGGYEMVAGHRRKMGSGLAGKSKMPCIIRDLTDDEATIIMVDSNLQREKILPSEKAFAYKMRLDAIRRQAGRPGKENSRPVGADLIGTRSDELLATKSEDSARQIQRYIRLTNLIPELLELVDNSVLQEKGKHQIALRPAVELSHLPKEQQQFIYDAIEGEDRTPSHAQTIKMRKFADEGRLNEDVILSIMQEEKPNQAEQLKLPREKLNRFFRPGTPAQKIESDIIKGLELLRQRERKRNDAR
ncbi:MAG: ParB/RepB/Spo0J family partition protein, partial [Clostridiales Family XIII bacterium]|nr:ParB/RepB/Spo0J family partition protein [Clostridiales Family XIII bacterium]